MSFEIVAASGSHRTLSYGKMCLKGGAMQRVFANRKQREDFIANEMVASDCDVYIASAFFTNAEVVEEMLGRGCRILMVVRLGFPTSPDAIERVIKHPNLQLRVYTSHSFHPKLYIFDDKVALVGSANLTRAALLSNQEVMVGIDAADDRFLELMTVFEEYWQEADVLTEVRLASYRTLYRQYLQHSAAMERLDSKVLEKLGETSPNNIERGRPKATKHSMFVSSFRRTYQECVFAFDILRRVYKESGYRKVSEQEAPLRLEIDSFISFVRDRYATGESWQSGPIRQPAAQEELVKELMAVWRNTPWPHFEERIVQENYPRFKHVFASHESILAADDSDLFDALTTLHSFHDRFRFYEGGLPTWKRVFPESNDPIRTRETLAYLVHGKGDIVERMANAIYSDDYKLNQFGRANVQELVGWHNREDLPVINGRTTKVLRYLGSKVQQLG